MTDFWRFLNPSSKTFFFFSPVHHTYSRIDYFIIDNKLIPQVKSSLYDSIIISDHTPVILELGLSGYGRISHVWSMNALLLSDGYFVELICGKKFHKGFLLLFSGKHSKFICVEKSFLVLLI